jgi:tetratricopeptide (TPR) repeat protein
MTFFLALAYLLAYPFALAGGFVLLLLLHESGHALAALALVPGPVKVYLGPPTHPGRGWQLRLGRLQFWGSRHLLDWRRGGYCQFSPAADTWRQVLIVLAGPGLPLLLASLGFYLSMHVANGTHRLFTLLFLFITLVNTCHNLFARQVSIRGSDGQRLLSDGQLLRQLLFPSPLQRQAAEAARYFAAKRYADSAVRYRQLLASPAPEAFFFQQLIYCCLCLQQYDEGVQIDARFRQERAAGYTDTDRSNGAVLLLHTQQLAPALAIYTALLTQESPHLIAYNNRGYTYSELGEHTLAIADFDQAIAVGVGVAEAHCNRAFSRLQLGQPAAAFHDLQLSLQLAPAAADTHANLGLYYFEQEDYPLALRSFEQASQLGLATPRLADYLQKTRQHLEVASGAGG